MKTPRQDPPPASERNENQGIEELQGRLGYTFGDRSILLQALTHTSYGHEFLKDRPLAQRNNERLEFLGDAILDVIISDILLEAFPFSNEGQLSKMRAAAVNEKTLAMISRGIRLHEVIRLGRGEKGTSGGEKPSILSSTFEALIAAVYLDGGFHAIYPVVRYLFRPLFSAEAQSLLPLLEDHKTHLQEKIQADHKVTPNYVFKGSTGPDHAKRFLVEVWVQGKLLATGEGNSKKEAEQAAAKSALAGLGIGS